MAGAAPGRGPAGRRGRGHRGADHARAHPLDDAAGGQARAGGDRAGAGVGVALRQGRAGRVPGSQAELGLAGERGRGRPGAAAGRGRAGGGERHRVAATRSVQHRRPHRGPGRRQEDAERGLRGGIGRRHLAQRRRRRELDVRVAERERADDGLAGRGQQRHAVGRHRRGEPARRRPDLLRRRHLQVDRRRRALDQHGADRQRRDRPHRDRPDQPEHRLRGGDRERHPLGLPARALPDHRRRSDLEARPHADDVDDRRRGRGDQPGQPEDDPGVAVGPQAQQRRARLRRRRLRAVQVD